MLKNIQQFVFAIQFLTRIPVPVKINYKDELPAKSMAYYPLVGAVLGIVLICIDIIISGLFPHSIVNILILIIFIYLTGGLHLDGFMDSIDGLFSGRGEDRVLEIMHDSRTGAFGVIAVILLILLKYLLLVELVTIYRYPVIFLMPVISRWHLVFAANNYPLAGGSKLGSNFSKYLTWKQLAAATFWLILLAVLVYIITGFPPCFIIIIFTVCWLFTLLFARYVQKKIEGLTGDIYGAINELLEVLVLLTFIAIGI